MTAIGTGYVAAVLAINELLHKLARGGGVFSFSKDIANHIHTGSHNSPRRTQNATSFIDTIELL